MSDTRPAGWIDEAEIPDANIKWAFSHFDGRADTYNDEGDHNFTIVLDEKQAEEMTRDGWNVKKRDGYEEGDPPEYHLEVKISFRFEDPLVYLVKGESKRKIRAKVTDLKDIRRSTTERVDVILKPHRSRKWQLPDGRDGCTAYVKELYAVVKESRFATMYDDYEEVG